MEIRIQEGAGEVSKQASPFMGNLGTFVQWRRNSHYVREGWIWDPPMWPLRILMGLLLRNTFAHYKICSEKENSKVITMTTSLFGFSIKWYGEQNRLLKQSLAGFSSVPCRLRRWCLPLEIKGQEWGHAHTDGLVLEARTAQTKPPGKWFKNLVRYHIPRISSPSHFLTSIIGSSMGPIPHTLHQTAFSFLQHRTWMGLFHHLRPRAASSLYEVITQSFTPVKHIYVCVYYTNLCIYGGLPSLPQSFAFSSASQSLGKLHAWEE